MRCYVLQGHVHQFYMWHVATAFAVCLLAAPLCNSVLLFRATWMHACPDVTHSCVFSGVQHSPFKHYGVWNTCAVPGMLWHAYMMYAWWLYESLSSSDDILIFPSCYLFSRCNWDQGTACGILVLVYQYLAMHVVCGVTTRLHKDASQHFSNTPLVHFSQLDHVRKIYPCALSLELNDTTYATCSWEQTAFSTADRTCVTLLCCCDMYHTCVECLMLF